MELIKLNCPSCNGEIELDENKEFGFCMYCGTKVMLHEVTKQNQPNVREYIETLLKTANVHLADKSYKTAYSYAKKILDIDVTEYRAWYIVANTTNSFTEKRAAYLRILSRSQDIDLVSKCNAEYSAIKNKICITLVSDTNGCKISVDDGKYVHAENNMRMEIITEKGIHKFSINKMSARYIFGQKQFLDCDTTVRIKFDMMKGSYVEFE